MRTRSGRRVVRPLVHGRKADRYVAEALEQRLLLATIFSDGFEGTFPGDWSVGNDGGGTATSHWGRNRAKASAGTYSAFCADNGNDQRDTYDNSLSSYLERRDVSLVNWGQPTLSFRYWLNTQTNLDPFVVRVKDSNGQWHEQFRDSGDDSNWGWQTQNTQLNSYSGESGLTIQFRFDSDWSTVPDAPSGVWLDEVCLSGEPLTVDLRGCSFYANSAPKWGQQLQVTGQVQNSGNGSSGAFTQEFYLSNDGTWGDADDVYLGSYAHASVGPYSTGQQFQANMQMPASPPSGYSSHGYYLLGMKTDADNAVTESDESNNGPGNGQGQDYFYANVSPAPDVELTVYRVSDATGTTNTSNPGVAQSAFSRGQTVRITLAGNNTGPSAPVRTTLKIRGPDDYTWVFDSHAAGQDNSADSPLNTGETDYYSFDWTIPVNASLGRYDLTAAIRNLNTWDLLYDDTSPGRNNETNGEIVQDQFGVWQPDLAGSACDPPASATWGQTISVSGRVSNLGGGPSGSFTQEFYLSADGAWGDADDVLVGTYAHPSVAPTSEAAAFNVSVTLPTAPPNSEFLSHGVFRIGMKTDANNQVAESYETNNGPGLNQYADWDSITLGPSANIDLTLYRISDTSGTANTSNPGTAISYIGRNQTLRITLAGNNTGTSAPVTTVLKIREPDNITWVYDSHSAGQDNSYDSPLNNGETDYYSFDWTVPVGADLGSYDLMAEIHDYSQYSLIYDDTSPGRNNEQAGPMLLDQFSVALPDLAGMQCIVPASASWGQTISIQGQVRNGGHVAATRTFTQAFFISADATWWNGDDYPLTGTYTHPAIGASTTGAVFNVSVTLPDAPPTAAYTTRGAFRIGMFTDAHGNIEESNKGNNGPGSFAQEMDWDSINLGPAASVDVNLYRVSDTTGAANTSNPGAATTQFRPGQTVRITLVADNTGASVPVKAQLKLRAPDDSTWAWDSHTAGADNGADSPLETGETDYYSFDWLVPSSISPGRYDVQGAIRDANHWLMVYDTTQTGRNNDFGGDDTKLDRFTADGIVWVNRGTPANDSDLFDYTYDEDADTARSIIDRAIFDWNRIITSFNYSGGGNTYSVTVNARSLGNLLGQATLTAQDADHKPAAGEVKMDDDGVGIGWYFDPVIGSATLPDDGEFTTIGGTWMARGDASTAGYDFYQTAVHEIGHLMGLLWDSSGTLRIMNYMTNTWITDKDNYYLYKFNVNGGPVEATFTTQAGGHLFEGPAVAGHPELPIHPHDCMNSGRALDWGGKQRLILSDIDAAILRDAYGYTITLPSTINTFYANLNTTTKHLAINGAPGVSDDNIRVDVDSLGRLRVQVNGTSEVFPLDAVDLILLKAGDGDDVIDLTAVPADIPVLVQMDAGDDRCNLGDGDLAGEFVGAITVMGGEGTDLLMLDDHLGTGADSYLVMDSAFDKTGFPWLEYHGLERLALKANGQHNDILVTETYPGAALVLDCGGGDDAVHVNLDDSGSAQVIFDSTQRLGTLDLHTGSTLTVDAGGDNVLVAQQIVMAAGARIDLNDNGLIWDYAGASPIESVRSMIISAYHGGIWDGNGIGSSLADATVHALGYAEASQAATGGLFLGQPVDATAVVVRYTFYGDTNLDGQVDVIDLGNLATAWQSGGDWINGDSNYDRLVDVIDLGLLATNWQAGARSALAPPAAGTIPGSKLLHPGPRLARRLP